MEMGFISADFNKFKEQVKKPEENDQVNSPSQEMKKNISNPNDTDVSVNSMDVNPLNSTSLDKTRYIL